jgi:hypothetical protein
MGKAILKCMTDAEVHTCGAKKACLVRARLKGFFGQIYLWIWWSPLAAWIRRVFRVGYA